MNAAAPPPAPKPGPAPLPDAAPVSGTGTGARADTDTNTDTDTDTDTEARAVRQTLAWVREAVVGLGLCPFAPAPWAQGRIRTVATATADEAALLALLRHEMQALAAADPAWVETTLIVHPNVLVDFDDYNDFLDLADASLEELGLGGVLQVASFHPDYRFAGVAADDLGNATNRSPQPMLQLLREASVERALDAGPDAEAILDANLRTLDRLGADGWRALRARWRAEAEAATDTPAAPPVPSIS